VHVITQKGDPYTKLFNTLCAVRMMSCVLSQLNIPCSNLVKLYYTEMWLFTVHITSISHVFQRIRFHQSRVIHISKNAVLFLE